MWYNTLRMFRKLVLEQKLCVDNKSCRNKIQHVFLSVQFGGRRKLAAVFFLYLYGATVVTMSDFCTGIIGGILLV